MKMMKVMILSAVLLMGTQVAAAKGGQNGNGDCIHADLNLSQAQKKQIRDIREQFQNQRPNKPLQNEMRALMNAKQFNRDRAEDLLEKREDVREERQIKRLQQQHAIYQVLDEKQREQWLAKHQRHGMGKAHKGKSAKNCRR